MVHSSPPPPIPPSIWLVCFSGVESGVLVKQTLAILGDYSREKICVILGQRRKEICEIRKRKTMRTNKQENQSAPGKGKKRSLLLWLLHTFPDAPANSTASSLGPPERIKTSTLPAVFCIRANCPNHSCQVWGSSVLEPSLGHVYDKYQIQEANPFHSQQGAESTWPPGVSAHTMWLGQADSS